MHAYTLNVRTWFDRINGNTYQSWLLRAAHGTVLHLSPMQYGSAQQAAHDAARYLKSAGLVPESVQYPRECMSIEHTGDGLRRAMHQWTWTTHEHADRTKPNGCRWDATSWHLFNSFGLLESFPKLTDARQAAVRRMAGGARLLFIERRAAGADRVVSVPWVTYTSTGPA